MERNGVEKQSDEETKPRKEQGGHAASPQPNQRSPLLFEERRRSKSPIHLNFSPTTHKYTGINICTHKSMSNCLKHSEQFGLLIYFVNVLRQAGKEGSGTRSRT